MLSKLIDYQLQSRTGFMPAVSGERLFGEDPTRVLAQLDSLQALLRSDEVNTSLDEELSAFRWQALPGGAFGRRAPAVMADMAIRVVVDSNLDTYLGIYSVDEYWLGVAGPYEVRAKKLIAEFLIYRKSGEDLEEINSFGLYLAINEAAKKSKVVMTCPSCELPGPGWELKGGDCNSCAPRVY